jgi:hypothetical protein
MKQIRISIHSFVDLITNSSSEIFSSAGDATVNAVKEIVNNILAAGGSLAKCNDLFNVKLSYNFCHDGENRYFDTSEERNACKEQFGCESDYDVEWSDLIVDAKDPTNKAAKDAAIRLENLMGTYDTWDQQN